MTSEPIGDQGRWSSGSRGGDVQSLHRRLVGEGDQWEGAVHILDYTLVRDKVDLASNGELRNATPGGCVLRFIRAAEAIRYGTTGFVFNIK